MSDNLTSRELYSRLYDEALKDSTVMASIRMIDAAEKVEGLNPDSQETLISLVKQLVKEKHGLLDKLDEVLKLMPPQPFKLKTKE